MGFWSALGGIGGGIIGAVTGNPIAGVKYGVTGGALLGSLFNSPDQKNDDKENLARKVEAGGVKAGDEVPLIAGSGWFPGYCVKKEQREDGSYNALFSLGRTLLDETFYTKSDNMEVVNDDPSGEVLLINSADTGFSPEQVEDSRFFLYNKKEGVISFDNNLTDFDWKDNARNVLSGAVDTEEYWFFANNLSQDFKKFRKIDINGNTIEEFNAPAGDFESWSNKNESDVFCFDNKAGANDIYTLYKEGLYIDYYETIEYDIAIENNGEITLDSSPGYDSKNIEYLHLSSEIKDWYNSAVIAGTGSTCKTYIDLYTGDFNLFLAASYNDDYTASLLGCYFENEDSFNGLSGAFSNFIELEKIDMFDKISNPDGLFICSNPNSFDVEPMICVYGFDSDSMIIHKISCSVDFVNGENRINLVYAGSEIFDYEGNLQIELEGSTWLDFSKYGFFERNVSDKPVLYIEPNHSASGEFVRVVLDRSDMKAKIDNDTSRLQREKIKCSDLVEKYASMAGLSQFDYDTSSIPLDYEIYGVYHQNQKNPKKLIDQALQYFNLTQFLEGGAMHYKATTLPTNTGDILSLTKKDISFSDNQYSTYSRDVIEELPAQLQMSYFQGGTVKDKSIVEHRIHSENESSQQYDTPYIDDERSASKRLFILAGAIRKTNLSIKIETKIDYLKWSVGDFFNYDGITFLITSAEIKKTSIIYEGTFFTKNDVDDTPVIPELPEYSPTGHKVFETALIVDNDREFVKFAGFPATQAMPWDGFKVENKNLIPVGSKTRHTPYGLVGHFDDKTESRYLDDYASRIYIQFPVNALPDEVSDDYEGMINEENLLAIGRKSEGYSKFEIIAYKNLQYEKDISLVGSEVTHKQYIVSGLLRGLYGTEKYMDHSFGDYVFVMSQKRQNDKNVNVIGENFDRGIYTNEIKYFLSTLSKDSGSPNYYNVTGESKRTKNIAHLSAYRQDKDFYISWTPRERIDCKDWQDTDIIFTGLLPTVKNFSFRIKIKDGGGTVYRTKILQFAAYEDFEYIYTEEMQANDFFGFPITTFYISIEEIGTGELPFSLDTFFIRDGIRY